MVPVLSFQRSVVSPECDQDIFPELVSGSAVTLLCVARDHMSCTLLLCSGSGESSRVLANLMRVRQIHDVVMLSLPPHFQKRTLGDLSVCLMIRSFDCFAKDARKYNASVAD